MSPPPIRPVTLEWSHGASGIRHNCGSRGETLGRPRGVGILAGADSGIPYVVRGFSLHDELYWPVKAGLSPMYFGITASSGSIAKGKFADLVRLNADPLQDIDNTRKIEAVVASGHYLTRAGPDRMLEKLRTE